VKATASGRALLGLEWAWVV